jgi:hypothetical protein
MDGATLFKIGVAQRTLFETTPAGKWRLARGFAHVVRELQEAGATIALEISSRNSRVAALQKRWDRLRASLDLIPD